MTTFYLTDTPVGGGNNFLGLQLEGSAPADATIATGWTPGTSGSTVWSLMEAGVERAEGTFNSSSPIGEPSTAPNGTLGDCFRSSQLTATYPAGVWVLNIPVIAVTGGGTHSGRFNFRLIRSANANGSSGTIITAALGTNGVLSTNTSFAIETTAQQVLTKQFTLGEVTLTNEYLFLQVVWVKSVVSANANDDVLIRVGDDAALIITEAATVVSGPFRAQATDHHCPGLAAGDIHSPGASAAGSIA